VIDLEASPIRRCFDGDTLIYHIRPHCNTMFRAAHGSWVVWLEATVSILPQFA